MVSATIPIRNASSYDLASLELQALRIRLCERSLEDYIRESWHVIEPSTAYRDNWHIGCIAEHLQACDAGQIRRLVINIPPRHMKSTIVTIDWPTWSWINDPTSRWVFASYSHALSGQHGRLRRTIVRSPWYRDRWGDRYAVTTDNDSYVQNDHMGHYIATSVGGSVTGMGGNRVIVDDPHSPENAWSDAEREAGIRAFDQTLTTRLDDPETGVIVVVMQRLHERDLTGHVLHDVGGYEHICLPAIAEGRTVVTMPYSPPRVREDGELLWPSRVGEDVLAEQGRALGSYGFAGQYQQRPSPPGGGIIKREWWKFYKALPSRLDLCMQSWDCAFKDTDGSDYVSGLMCATAGGDRYIIDCVNARMTFGATKTAIRSFTAKHPRSHGILIEDKANGTAVIDELSASIAGIIAVDPKGGKTARAHAAAPQIEAGNVYLPDPSIAPWVHDFIEQCASFPYGAHDDMVDAITQFLCHVGIASDETLRVASTQTSMSALPGESIGSIYEDYTR